MKTLGRILQRHIHTLAIAGCTLTCALLMAGCASDGGGGGSGRSIAELKAAAEKGDPEAQLELGKAFEYGRGVPRDYVEAEKWYKRAAETFKARSR